MARSLIDTGAAGMAGRFLRSRKLRALLTALGVAFGVALIAALTVMGATLQASIEDQLREGFGTYDVMAGYDGGKLMTPADQARVKNVRGLRYTVGVLYASPEDPAAAGAAMEHTYIGMGAFPNGEFAYPLTAGHYPGPGEMVADPRLAGTLQLQVGDATELPFKSGTRRVTLVGLTRASGPQSSNVLMFNLEWLQQEMGVDRQVTLMLLGTQPGTRKETIGADLKTNLPDLHIELRRELDDARENMGGLRPVAITFGIAGLFAAMFLVAGSFRIAVHERSRELALLRAVGAVGRQVEGLILREAVLLGAAGSVAGVGLGVLGAWGALGLAAASLGVRHHAPVLPWLQLALEALGGMLLAMAVAWRPARAAGKVPPLQAMRPDAAREALEQKAGGTGGLILMGVAVAACGLAWVLKNSEGLRLLLGAGSGIAFVAGLIWAQPVILPRIVNWASAPLKVLFPAEATLAGRAVLRHRRRSAQTAATLILGVMLVTSVSTVFGQMAANGDTFTRSQFPGDAVVRVPSGTVFDLGTGLAGKIAAIDGVRGTAALGQERVGHFYGLDLTKADPVWLAKQNQPNDAGKDVRTYVSLVPFDLAPTGKVFDYGRIKGDLSKTGVAITEQQARDWGIALGDVLHYRPSLAKPGNPDGPEAAYAVVAVVERLPLREYQMAVSRSLFPDVPDAAVFFNYDPARRDAIADAVRAAIQEPPYSLGYLEDLRSALDQDRQALLQRMAILWAVALVIFMIAAFGLFNATVMSLHQRQREMAALRAVGATPPQITCQVILETVLVGLSGSLLGIVAGCAFVGAVWVALNDGSLSLWYGRYVFLAALVTGPAVAAISGLGPALRLVRQPVGPLLQAE
jgi:putative ABC transport system permease protein